MDRTRVWPDFRDAWIVHEDADLIVIDKPVGVSSQAADPQRPDDVVTRLKRFLRQRADGDPYVGVHQRLDRDTSGLLLYARRREANAHLALQFERRVVKKTYVACVSHWPPDRERATLRDALARGPDGNMRVVSAGAPGAKEASMRARVVARNAERAILELELDTGRTHQARIQLSHAGAAIAGDAVYGGEMAPRLMLHASRLELEHPHSRERVRFTCKMPPEFNDWLSQGDRGEAIYDDESALTSAFEHALERRWGLGRADAGPEPTTAFRLVNEDGDSLPRLAVDVYGTWLVAQLYDEDGPWSDGARRESLLDRLHGLGFDGVYLKVRPKQANVIVDTRRAEVAPALPVRGVEAPEELTILEEGVPFLVRLGDGLSTGLFLDQRTNRRRVREMAAGKSVANLFSYTCGFTVAAALGGAARTVSVDASASALERGRTNLVRAGVFDPARHALVAQDSFAWLDRCKKRDERFDLVIVDPPSYSTTRRGRFAAQSDYESLASAALAIVSPGGRLLACTNHRGISHARFRRMLFDACRRAKREPAQVKDLPPPPDFPFAPGTEPHTKSVLVTLAG